MAAGFELGSELRDVDVDRIDEAAVRGLIGAHALAVVREQMMERIDAGDCAAHRFRGSQKRRNVSKSPMPASRLSLSA